MAEPAVDVVVPVYGGAGDLARCVHSMLHETDFRRHRLIFVVDGPQADGVDDVLRRAERSIDELAILRQERRCGYVSAANTGMEYSSRDVVLLNSDTEVTPGWLEKLQRAALSAPNVATATPLSNNASICSVPHLGVENLLPAGYDARRFACLVDRLSTKSYPRLPTGVGFCLYIRREALTRIGLFDERLFGFGYGEEADFCMRARAAGYEHVAADDAFVYHRGQGSFGKSRRRRVRRAHRVLLGRHPEYLALVSDWLREDPLRRLRGRLVSELSPARPDRRRRPRVLHLVHGWPPFNHAGTESYARWLSIRQVKERDTAVFARVFDSSRETGDIAETYDSGVRVRLVVNNFDQRDPLARNALWNRRFERHLGRYLDEFRPDLVHAHHLAGHGLSVLRAVRRRRLPVVWQVQDWWTCCARVNLLHRDGDRCGGPGLAKCSHCLPLTRRPPAIVWNLLLYGLRRRLMRWALRKADHLIAGSHFVVESLQAYGCLWADAPITVIPYGIDLADTVQPKHRHVPPRKPLRFGFIGSLLPHKGLHVAAEAFRDIDPSKARLDVWGDPRSDPEYTSSVIRLAGRADLNLRGRFVEAEKQRIFEGIDILVVPSVGLESFGLVLREALHCGVPVLASRCGAPEELLADQRFGALFDHERPHELRSWIEHLVERPVQIVEWRENIPEILGMSSHAEEIEAVYDALPVTRRPWS